MLIRLYRLLKYLTKKYHLNYYAVFILAILLFSWLQGNYTLPEPDSFYHAKIAQFISQGQILHQLPWLQETSLAEEFVDHHFLYHLFLIPFVILDDPLVGVKMATIFFVSLASLIFYWFLKRFRVPYAFLYVLILFVSRDWLFRASLVKAPVVFLLFVILAYYFLSKKSWLALALISFFSVWLYGGWPFLIAMSIIYAISYWFLENFKKGNFLKQKIINIFKLKNLSLPWVGVGVTISGALAGLLVNPYFPANINFYWLQTVKIAFFNYQDIIRVGKEWYPYDFVSLLMTHPLILSLLTVGILLLALSFKRQSVHSLVWGVLALIFLLLTLKSMRNVEFFIPFTIIFFAFSFSDYFKEFFNQDHKSIFSLRSWIFLTVLLFVFILAFVFKLPQDFLQVKKNLLVGHPLDRYKKVSLWLRENTPKESIIFNSNWGEFPFLFYYNDQDYYLTGLDPTFMYEKDKDKYWLYESILKGEVIDNLPQIIKQNFHTDYIVLSISYEKFDKVLGSNDFFNKVYEDKEAKVYQIINYEQRIN